MKIPWINVKDKKPAEDDWVLCLFGTDDDHSLRDMEYREHEDNIILAQWCEAFDDFISQEHQKQFSRYWFPIYYTPSQAATRSSEIYESVVSKTGTNYHNMAGLLFYFHATSEGKRIDFEHRMSQMVLRFQGDDVVIDKILVEKPKIQDGKVFAYVIKELPE